MPYFVICGTPDCGKFIQAIHVADYLSHSLPNFQYEKIEIENQNWTDYLYYLNQTNRWYVSNSPAIWKELNTRCGQKYLLGGLSEFFEYCYDYYDMDFKITSSQLRSLIKENIRFFHEQQNETNLLSKQVLVIGIIGACNSMITTLLYELIQIKKIEKKRGLLIKLYDDQSRNKNSYKFMDSLTSDLNATSLYGNREFVMISDTLPELIKNCDLLIHIQDFRKREEEFRYDWLRRIIARIGLLADTINGFGKRTLRVVFNNQGPACFLATWLIEFCVNIKIRNIVVITSDQGLSMLGQAASRFKSEIGMEQISTPPVWGFVPTFMFVDIGNALYKTEVCTPFPSALKKNKPSCLPLGKIITEYNVLSTIISDESLDNIKIELEENRVKIEGAIGRPPILSKIRSLLSVLELWYGDEIESHIISLGVCANGAFGFPEGIVFSQPVILNKRKVWVPLNSFPITDATRHKITELISPTEDMLYGSDFRKEVKPHNVKYL